MPNVTDEFTLEDFRAEGSFSPPPRNSKARRSSKRWFLKGPIPGDWLAKAAHLPGKALHVGLAVWHLSALKNRTTVRLTRQALDRFGVNRDSGYRGLNALERAQLVRVERRQGRRPIVQILRVK